ncbi:LolA family protein [Conchiformibius kuhniae]|uniref:Outer membrane lipoprotein carrier protein LolA n=1 Tax=Conchiformibius kuhniae TaxID=211502 RepID=A0A8T9MTQ3_9NEIS|nr:outer membrane lipoprotein carrier protein LolA [Conchiformibius kuhniae]UOP04641.1 outer membrane lipoprotein carrier protein LolA [Conchiformibius kuhniae]
MKTKLFFSTLLLTAAAAAAQAFSPADLQAQLQKNQTVQGQFEQSRFIRSLNRPMQTSGTFVLQRQKGLLWQVQKPLEIKLRVRGDGIAQWDAKNRRWHGNGAGHAQAAQVKLFMALLGGDTAALNKQFDLRLSGSPQNWSLKLQPKTAVMKQVFEGIDVAGNGALIQKVELREKQGERTVMRFLAQQANRPLAADARAALE